MTVIPLGILYLLFANTGEHAALTLRQFAGDIFLVPRTGALTLDPAWTLQHEIVFYAIFSSLLVSRRLGAVVFICWQIACFAYLILGPAPQDFLDPVSKFLGFYNFGFAFGIAVALFYRSRFFALFGRPILVAAFIASGGLVVMYVGEWRWEGEFPENDALRTVLYYLLYSLVMLGGLALPRFRRPRLDVVLGTLGTASYALYLTHEVVSAVTVKIVNRIGVDLVNAPFSAMMLVVCVSVFAAVVIHTFVERPMLRFLRQRFAGRARNMPSQLAIFNPPVGAQNATVDTSNLP